MSASHETRLGERSTEANLAVRPRVATHAPRSMFEMASAPWGASREPLHGAQARMAREQSTHRDRFPRGCEDFCGRKASGSPLTG